MNFLELEKIIQSIRKQYNSDIYSSIACDNLRVCIPIQVVGTVGGTPCVDVKYINTGFDWDKGKLILTPEKLLRETDRDEIRVIMEKYDELGDSLRTIRNLKRENRKLKEEFNTRKNEI